MSKPINILLVEDDIDDVDLLKEAFEDNKVSYEMDVIKDGGLVNDYIEKCTSYPDVIVLDFNLPRVHGTDLLKIIKKTPAFSHIPVCILTTSSAQRDMDFAYREGAYRYFVKPSTVAGINTVVSGIVEAVKKSDQ